MQMSSTQKNWRILIFFFLCPCQIFYKAISEHLPNKPCDNKHNNLWCHISYIIYDHIIMRQSISQNHEFSRFWKFLMTLRWPIVFVWGLTGTTFFNLGAGNVLNTNIMATNFDNGLPSLKLKHEMLIKRKQC